MSAYKHKSGFQKRKEKEIREIEASKGLTSLNKYIQSANYRNSSTVNQPSCETMIESEYLLNIKK